MALPAVAIALGDPAGIGPEIALKAALDPEVLRRCRPVLVGDREVLALHAKPCGLSLEKVEILERKHPRPKIGTVAPEHGRSAIDSAETAVRAALEGRFAAVIGAPHNETAIHAAGIEFDGYPSFIARIAGLPPEDGVLMICFEYQGREVRIAHVTLHVSVLRALELISLSRVLKTIRSVNHTLKKLGIQKPRIAVSGLNPHAGEGGLFGGEDLKQIKPAIEAARAEGMSVDGPIGADIMIQRPGYDAYVVMLHDQGHVAAKLLAPQRAAGLTIGTPVLFSSVAHGSALDIAGQGKASHRAMVEAIARVVPA